MGGRLAAPDPLDRLLPPCRFVGAVVVVVADCVAGECHVSERR